MNLVTLENVSKQFSERILLDSVNLLINEGDRIGLIGRNGSGKTTLLEIIAGTEPLDAGTRTVWGGVHIVYAPQEPILDDDLTVLDTLYHSDAPLMRLLRNYEQTNQQLQHSPHDADLQAQLSHLTEEMERLKGWTAVFLFILAACLSSMYHHSHEPHHPEKRQQTIQPSGLA